MTLSRTGYTGDLGYEVTVPSDRAVDVLDAVLDAGDGHGMRPFGEEALMMLRIEAGLPLIDVEWHNSRTAFTDADRVTPKELGLGWMLRGVRDGDRAVRRARGDPARARSTAPRAGPRRDRRGLAGVGPAPPRRRAVPAEGRAPAPLRVDAVRRRPGRAGRLRTSFMYSPVLQRHIGLARVRPDLATPGTDVRLEIALAAPHHDGRAPPRPRCPLRPAAEDRQAGGRPVDEHGNNYDAIVVGGGHNGLTNAAYLAKAGLRTLVLERRDVVGGAAITEELHPRLLVHHVLLRAEPAAPGDHPRARPGRARLPAADDAVVVPPDRRRRLPAARRRPRPEPAGDPAPLAARRRRLRPLPPRPRPGLPGDPAAVRQRAARTSSARTPRTRPTSGGCSTTSAASSAR